MKKSRVIHLAANNKKSGPPHMDLSIIIPALNEADNLKELLPKIHQTLRNIEINYEIIVVDEKADQKTISVVKQNQAILIQPTTTGFGNAIINGINSAKGDYIVTMDSDQSHPTHLLLDLWEARETAEVIIASRYVPFGSAIMPKSRYYLSKILNKLFSRGLGLGVLDMSSGFRMYTRYIFRNFGISSRNFDIEQELLVLTHTSGYRIREIPFVYQPRSHGKSNAKILKFGLDYIRTFYRLWKLRNSIFSADYDARAYNTWLWPQRFWQRQRFRHISELVQGKNKCLDVGCGSSHIIGILPPGSVALDILEHKLRYSKRYQRYLVNGSVLELPFLEASFPTVLCSQVIEHIPGSGVLNELDRVLIPGGKLVLGTPDYDKWQWNAIEWLYGKLLPQAYADEHISHYSRDQLIEEFVHKRGYKLVDFRYILQGELILSLEKSIL